MQYIEKKCMILFLHFLMPFLLGKSSCDMSWCIIKMPEAAECRAIYFASMRCGYFSAYLMPAYALAAIGGKRPTPPARQIYKHTFGFKESYGRHFQLQSAACPDFMSLSSGFHWLIISQLLGDISVCCYIEV